MTSDSRTDLLERWIAAILRSGILLSAFLLIVGLVVWSAAAHASSASSFMYAGLVVLMLTPFFRVTATVIVFIIEREWKFVLVALLILFMLVSEVVIAFR